MAGEDVIELVSSDEESDPVAPPTRSVPRPNAMVHIPKMPVRKEQKKNNKTLGGIRIVNIESMMEKRKKPLPVPIHNGIGVNPLSFRQSVKHTNIPQNIKQKVAIPPQTSHKNSRDLNAPFLQGFPKILKTNLPILPKVTNSQLLHTKTSPPSNQQGANCLQRLPPGLTIKKMSQPVPAIIQRKRTLPLKPGQLQKKSKIEPHADKFNVGAVLTVELDDDEDSTNQPAAVTALPSWYIRPEDATAMTEDNVNMEEENNREPTNQVLEIEIEDSPVKAKNSIKQMNKENEFAIIIEDSPVKMANKEKCEKLALENEKTPNSKKELLYPDENNHKGELMVEIDIQENNDKNKHVHKTPEKKKPVNIDMEVIDLDTPLKMETEDPKSPKTQETVKEIMNSNSHEGVKSEFHPIYQEFINVCFELENSEDMKKIVEKKIKNYYNQVPKSYTESDAFIEMVTFKIKAMKECPTRLYLHVKDIVDELNLQRKIAKTEKVAPAEEVVKNQTDAFDSKRSRQIKKLEKTLRKLHMAIQKLDEQEINFNDEENSVYLLTERYQKRLVQVHAKLCQLQNVKMPSEPRIHVESRPGQPKGPSKRLEAFINKKVPVGGHLPFPDFHDVLNCVRNANKEDKLGWNEAEIMEEARDLFSRCGKKLQRRRQENEWRLASYRLHTEKDPAEVNADLKTKLDQNSQLAAKKESEVLNKYVDRQIHLNLEPVEVRDKDLDESSMGSDYDSAEETCSEIIELNKEKLEAKEMAENAKSEEIDDKQTKSSECLEKIVDEEENKDTANTDQPEAEFEANNDVNEEAFEISDSETDFNCSDIEATGSPISISDSDQSSDVASIKSCDAVMKDENKLLTENMEVEEGILIDSDSQGSVSICEISNNVIDNDNLISNNEKSLTPDGHNKSAISKDVANDVEMLDVEQISTHDSNPKSAITNDIAENDTVMLDIESTSIQDLQSTPAITIGEIENNAAVLDIEKASIQEPQLKTAITIDNVINNTEMLDVRQTSTQDSSYKSAIVLDDTEKDTAMFDVEHTTIQDFQSKTAIPKDTGENDAVRPDAEKTCLEDPQSKRAITEDVTKDDNVTVPAEKTSEGNTYNDNLASKITKISSLTKDSETCIESNDSIVKDSLVTVISKVVDVINREALAKGTLLKEDNKLAEILESSAKIIEAFKEYNNKAKHCSEQTDNKQDNIKSDTENLPKDNDEINCQRAEGSLRKSPDVIESILPKRSEEMVNENQPEVSSSINKPESDNIKESTGV